MFVVFYTVNLYILCIYDLFHNLLSLWHTYGSMECTYVCHTHRHSIPGQVTVPTELSWAMKMCELRKKWRPKRKYVKRNEEISVIRVIK
jgi:hypothetical protein